MNAPASVLIVRLSSIGDVVHTLPAFMALRRAWPETRCGWAVEEAAADLLTPIDGVEVHVVPIQSWRRRLTRPETWRAIRAARARLQSDAYAMAIDFQGLLKSALVARGSTRDVIGFARRDCRESIAATLYRRAAPPIDPTLHIVQRNLSLAGAATGRSDPRVEWPSLTTPEDDRTVGRELDRLEVTRPILIHAAANWASKRYPVERYVEAARRLHAETERPVLWIWGPGEKESAHELAAAAGPGSQAAFATRLPQLCALLRRASLLVGGDSAPLHLAVACGTPTVAVFGPTDPDRLGPLEARDRVVVRTLECSHCHRRECPLGTNECLETIPADEIVESALARLDAS